MQEPDQKAHWRADALTAIGWFIAGAGAILGAATAAKAQNIPDYAPVFIAFGIGIGSAGISLGLFPISVAQSIRPSLNQGRWKLWAKLALIFGATLCISVPATIYAFLPFELGLVKTGHRIKRSDPSFDALNAELWSDLALDAGLPFTLGAGLIAFAVIRGRREPAPGVPAIFS
jgi:hypothetical protein